MQDKCDDSDSSNIDDEDLVSVDLPQPGHFIAHCALPDELTNVGDGETVEEVGQHQQDEEDKEHEYELGEVAGRAGRTGLQ